MADVVALVAVPSAFTYDDAVFFGEVQKAANRANSAAKQDVEFGNAEGRSHLVLGHLHLRANAEFFGAALEGLNASDVQAHGGVELQGVTTGGGFGVAVGHANLLTQLVQEDHGATGLADVAGDLAHRLAHQAGLAADGEVAHFALDF